jgi:hypothetical protein
MSEQIGNQGGFLRYRCRMCGEEFENTHVPDVARAVMAITCDFPNPWPAGMPLPKLVEPHYHKDGYGVADMIGGVEDPREQ